MSLDGVSVVTPWLNTQQPPAVPGEVAQVTPITIPPEIQREIIDSTIEIGHIEVAETVVEQTTDSLELAPSIAFEVADRCEYLSRTFNMSK